MVLIDTARYCESNEEIDIDDLEEEVSSTGISPDRIRRSRCFKCLGCELLLIPKAIDRSINVVSAHFAAKHKLSEHDPTCDIGRYLRFAKNRDGLYEQGEGFPFGYPSKLELINIIRSVQVTSSEQNSVESDSDRFAGNQNTLLGKHNRTVKSLKLLVKHFIAFPEPEFRRSPLTVPGIGISTYAEVFQSLKWQRGCRYPSVRVYYAEILWTKTRTTNNRILIYTTEGEWIDNKPPQQSIYLEIDISQWTEAQREVTKKWVSKCIKRARSSESTEREKPWLFFLGNQVEGNDYKFQLYTNDYRTLYLTNDNSFEKGPASWMAVSGTLSQDTEFSPTAEMPETVADQSSLSVVEVANAENLRLDNESENSSSAHQVFPEILEPTETISGQFIPQNEVGSQPPIFSTPITSTGRNRRHEINEGTQLKESKISRNRLDFLFQSGLHRLMQFFSKHWK